MADAAPDPRRWKALAVLGVAYLMVILDVSIVNVALPSIQKDLDFSTENLQWVVSAYALTFGGFLLLGGRMGDVLGRRKLFMAGLAFFALFSLLCGFSVSAGMLIGARALQGLAGAALSPSVFSITSVTFKEGAERNKALGILGAIAGLGCGDRGAPRRRLDPVRGLGVDLLRQRPDRHSHLLLRAALRPREPRRRHGTPVRLAWRGHRHGEPHAPRVRADSGEQRRLGIGSDDRRDHRVGPADGSLHRDRAALREPARPAQVLPQANANRREHHRARARQHRVLDVLPPVALHAGDPRLLCSQDRESATWPSLSRRSSRPEWRRR